MDSLLDVHADLIVDTVNEVLSTYRTLISWPVRVYVERNTSHAHAALMAKQVTDRFAGTSVDVSFEKETRQDGARCVGLWTRNKGNLVHLSQMLLENDRVAFSEDIDVASMETLQDQLRNFRRLVRSDGKITVSGKSVGVRDDLAMTFILWLAWTCFFRS